MKIKSFLKLYEENERNTFNAFVEDVFDGKWQLANKDFGNFTDKFPVKDADRLYRIRFYRKENIERLSRVSDLKRMIKGEMVQENQGHPVFFTKDDYHNIKDHLSFLASMGMKIHGYTDESAEQYYMGIITAQKVGSGDNVDFSHYKDGNSQIRERVDVTKPVLAVNNSQSFDVVASLEFDRNGWEINEFNNDMNDLVNEPEPEGEPEGEEEVAPEGGEGEEENAEMERQPQ